MAIFLSLEEYQSCSDDASIVAEKADAFIRELMNQLETVNAQADAYVSLSSDFSSLQCQHYQLHLTWLGELLRLQAQNHQSHLLSMGKDGEMERLSTEASELHKSKRQLMELLELKDVEISEKNSTIKSYLDKIVNLTENASSKEARLSDLETELAQSQASHARFSQEKELVERHNSWLNEELKTKVDNLIELRKTHSELEVEMSVKLAEGEKRWNENLSSLKWNEDRVKELESKLASLQQELMSGKDAAVATEKQFSAEISTLTKLVELYKESSEEWSKKAGELEGVIKALETHLSQVENDNKERLEKEISARKVIEKVLHEIEEKAGVILDERVHHQRTVEAYSALNQKLQHSLSEQTTLLRHIQELKANMRRNERECAAAQKEIVDLQKQVSVLLKECRDIQLRCGSIRHDFGDALMTVSAVSPEDEHDTEDVPELMLPFKDISGLVEQNVQLRRLVHGLSEDIESRETELKEKYEKELQKHSDEAASKVSAVLARAEEQGHMIESLHTSVAMYKKLCEEGHKFRFSSPLPEEPATEGGRQDITVLIDDSHEPSRKAQEKTHERVKHPEEELGNSRSEIISLRSECNKLALEAQLAREKLERFMKEFDQQRDQHNGLLARNVEFSQLIIDYQRKLRESSDSLNAAEELSRKLTMEVSLIKQEKEILLNSEKRAAAESCSLSERVHRLQASLDTIQSTEEVREEARCAERRKQELYVKQIEREWAEAKKELHEERDKVRHLTLERENGMNNALKQVVETGKELSKTLHALAAAEARASVAEARCSDLEEKLKLTHMEASEKNGKGGPTSTCSNEIVSNLHNAKEEIEKLREEAQINKDHMLQYKSIAQANEEALKQLEVAHENSKAEAEIVKKSPEAKLLSLRETVNEHEEKCINLLDRLHNARGEGHLDSGIVDMKASKVELQENPKTVHVDSMSGASTILFTFTLDRGITWESASALLKERQLDGCASSNNGFYDSKRERLGRRHFLLAFKGSSSVLYKIFRPAVGEALREMSLAELKDKYRKISSLEKARTGWEGEYDISSKQCMHGPNCKLGSFCTAGRRLQEVNVLGGLILPVLGTIEKALSKQARQSHKRIRVVRIETTSENQRIVGLLIPNAAVESVLQDLAWVQDIDD